MTDETPARTPVFCGRCSAAVRLGRDADGSPALVCACVTTVSIDDLTGVPEEWE
jgi:hypothetical protein